MADLSEREYRYSAGSCLKTRFHRSVISYVIFEQTWISSLYNYVGQVDRDFTLRCQQIYSSHAWKLKQLRARASREREREKQMVLRSIKSRLARFAIPKGLATKMCILRPASCHRRRRPLLILSLFHPRIHMYVQVHVRACARRASRRAIAVG